MTAMVKSVDGAGLFWDGLAQELAAWQAAGARASFWWRDDDAVAASPALERLTGLSATSGAPVAIAAIPKLIEPSLAPAVARHSTVRLLQHGFAHIDHAKGLVDPAKEGKGAWELGLHRPMDIVLGELEAGRAIMQGAFGAQFLPVVAAPWNHVAPQLMPGLRERGFLGVSSYGERPLFPPLPGFVEANIHFDVSNWKHGARFRGEAAALEMIVGHLRRRRSGEAEQEEPTGIVTHHAALDEASWRFMAELLAFVSRHPAAVWLSPQEIFTSADRP
jgi:hypothetical protein